jgi:hypothetical protein
VSHNERGPAELLVMAFRSMRKVCQKCKSASKGGKARCYGSPKQVT